MGPKGPVLIKRESEMEQEYPSAGTSGKQLPRGFRKMYYLGIISRPPSRIQRMTNLDLGGGRFDIATKFLKSYRWENLILDPYNQEESEASATLEKLWKNPADTGTCFNVLNVIKEPEVRRDALMCLRSLVKKEGLIVFSVYSGDKSGVGKPSKRKGCWQEHRKLKTYLDEIQEVFPIFVYVRENLLVVSNPGV
jgi:hypothetical protein